MTRQIRKKRKGQMNSGPEITGQDTCPVTVSIVTTPDMPSVKRATTPS